MNSIPAVHDPGPGHLKAGSGEKGGEKYYTGVNIACPPLVCGGHLTGLSQTILVNKEPFSITTLPRKSRSLLECPGS